MFELITYYSDTLQDSIEFSAGSALLIVYQAIFIITGALIIAFSVVMLCKIKKNKKYTKNCRENKWYNICKTQYYSILILILMIK